MPPAYDADGDLGANAPPSAVDGYPDDFQGPQQGESRLRPAVTGRRVNTKGGPQPEKHKAILLACCI